MPVRAGLGPRRARDPAVGVGLAGADELVAAPELDADAGGGQAALGVEDVGGDGHRREPRGLDARARARSPPRRRGRAGRRDTTSRRRRAAGRRGAGRRGRARADEVVGAAELEPVGAPDRDVGALARLERADVVAAEHGGAAARREPQRLAGGHRRRRRRGRGRRAAPASPRGRGRCARSTPSRRRRARRARRRRAARGRARSRRRAAGSRSGSARRRRPGAANRRPRPVERWTQCAHQTSPSSQPTRSRYSTGVQP